MIPNYIILPLLTVLALGAAPNTLQTYTFKDSIGMVSFLYPKDWKVDEDAFSGGGPEQWEITTFICPREQGWANLSIFALQNQTLAKVSEDTIKETENDFHSKIISVSALTLGGRPAYELIMDVTMKHRHRWMLLWIDVGNNRLFQFTFRAEKDLFDSYYETVKGIAESLSIK